MKTFSADVLVFGAGLAGTRSAIAAKVCDPDLDVTILAPGPVGFSGCSPKTHGVNAALNPTDTVEQHITDTLIGGGNINDPALVKILCEGIPAELHWLETLGVVFDKTHTGEYDCGFYGGSSQGRSIHSKDMAGRLIIQALGIEITSLGVHFRTGRHLMHLVVGNNGIAGALVFNSGAQSYEIWKSKAVILATGGGACVYPVATISADKSAGGIIAAWEAGCHLTDMEMVQFHPTGLNRPGEDGHGEILEEELRSMGGRFINCLGQAYMSNYDPRAERATRDVVSRSTFMEILKGRGTSRGGVMFDVSAINKRKLAERFPFMLQRLESYGVDLLFADEVEISPAAHFLMGGIVMNEKASTEIPGLFVCGEDAGGIHGGNRLGGNGVADALVFGNVAGTSAAAHAASVEMPVVSPDSVEPFGTYAIEDTSVVKATVAELKKLMWTNLGPVRSGQSIERAVEGILSIKQRLAHHFQMASPQCSTSLHANGRTVYQQVQLASNIATAAAIRTNNVGAHWREDAVTDETCYNTLTGRHKNGAPAILKKEHTPQPAVPVTQCA